MSRTALISASALLLATSAAHAFDTKAALGLQAPGVSVQANADASAKTPTLQSSKDAALHAGHAAKDAGLAAGVGALTSGKSAIDSGKAAGQAAYGNAKDAALSNAAAAKNAALTKAGVAQDQAGAALGQGKQIAAGYKQDAANAISVKDRVAVAKFAATQKAGGKVVGKLTSLLGGANAQANGGLAAGYEKKLVIGAKLDAGLSSQAKALDTTTVTGLGAQPKGTQLLLVGDQIVRVDSKTQVVLDVSAAASL